MPHLELTPDALREWRASLGLTQRAAASARDVNIRTWQKWEGGELPIPSALLDTLRYRSVCRDELRDLGLGFSEACLVCDALNGLAMTDIGDYRVAWINVADHIRLNGADEKWSVNGDQLLARLRSLSPGGMMALVDAAERFWAHEGATDDALHASGLTQEEAPPELPEWME